MQKWICQVCGYVHEGAEPPETCPVCGASRSAFEKTEAEPSEKITVKASVTQRWRCTVCGYVHEGAEPPEICPVCGAPQNAFEKIGDEKPIDDEKGKQPSFPSANEGQRQKKSWKQGKNLQEKIILWLDTAISQYHLHPISVHVPNGVLPVAVLFLVAGIFFDGTSLKTAAFLNMCMVLFSLPLVIYTGLVVWRDRYGASFTPLFRMKILCAATLAFCVLGIVLWRLISPDAGGPFYIFLHLVALGAAGFAGHLGSKLVFGGTSGRKE